LEALDKLVALSAELGSRLSDDEALRVNAAILELEPNHAVATSRLGIGLLNAGRAAEAAEVLEAGLRAHPGNAIMRRRLDEARRASSKPPTGGRRRAPRRRRDASAAAVTAWVKAIHYDGDGGRGRRAASLRPGFRGTEVGIL
jgi:predicted Zn-dependent protease